MASDFIIFQFEVTARNFFWLKLILKRLKLRVIINFLVIVSDCDIEPVGGAEFS
jgi:hypothetical protein